MATNRNGIATPSVAGTDFDDWQKLTALVGLATVTGLIEGCKPLSMMIVGSPGSGKTKLLKRYDHPANRHIYFGTNASAWGLQAVLGDVISRGVSCIMAPEFQTWIYRKGRVWDSLLGMLLPATDEGVGTIYNGPVPKHFGGARLGLIAAMTRDTFDAYRGQFSTTGLLSRMLVVLWDRSSANIGASRRRYNAGDHRELEEIAFRTPLRKTDVEISGRLADRCESYAEATAPGNLNRDTDRFIALTKAQAYISGRVIAEDRDWDTVREAYSPFWDRKLD